MIFRNRGSAPWEGTIPLTGQAIVDFFSPDTKGEKVSPNEALTLAPVFRAANILAGTIAGAKKQYLDENEDSIDVPRDQDIVNFPNPMFDAWLFWEAATLAVIFHGNFYAIMSRQNRRGPVRYLTPLDPSTVEPKIVTRGKGRKMRVVDIMYVWTMKSGEKVGIPADEMFHVAGLGWDGLTGVSILEHGRRVFRNALNTDEFAERFFGQGSLASGVLTTDKRLDEPAAKALQNRWKKKVQGLKNAFDIVILDSGTHFESITVNPKDAQFIDSRRFNVEEIGRMLGIPAELLGEVTEGTAIDPEKLGILYTTFTGNFWTGRFESAIDRQLLSDDRRIVFNINHMVQSDERTNSSAAVMWRTAQVLSVNELRTMRGHAKIEDPRADDVFYVAEKPEGATRPGENQGKQEQPVPGDQEPQAGTDSGNNQ